MILYHLHSNPACAHSLCNCLVLSGPIGHCALDMLFTFTMIDLLYHYNLLFEVFIVCSERMGLDSSNGLLNLAECSVQNSLWGSFNVRWCLVCVCVCVTLRMFVVKVCTYVCVFSSEVWVHTRTQVMSALCLSSSTNVILLRLLIFNSSALL